MLDISKLKTAAGYQDHSNNTNRLTGLTATTYILKWLSKGYTKDQIYAEFNGDIRLVSAWIDFLKDKKWIVQVKKEDGDDDIDRTGLKVTKEGKTWLKRFESANIKVNK
jgi:hypothetical protein